MHCGIKSMAAAVDVPYLIKRLDIERPYSPTHGDTREERPFVTTHKGMRFYIKPQADNPHAYVTEMRGSLAKYANAGRHNRDGKNPFDSLRAVDELVTDLRVNPFDTLLNNLEVSVTIRVADAKRIINNVLAYRGQRPKRKWMDNGLCYAELEATHHSIKLYEPAVGSLRIEFHANRMASLGDDRPHTLADLALPRFAVPMADRLLDAFSRIHWNCAGVNPDTLPKDEGYLLAKGRDPAYWYANKKGISKSEYNRLRKQRERERRAFDMLVSTYWTEEPLAQLTGLMRQQLTQYAEIMHSEPYQKALRSCWARWQVVANLPVWAKLPERPQLVLLSQTYPSYIGKPATMAANALAHPPALLYSKRPTVSELYHQAEMTDGLLDGHKPNRSKSPCKKESREQKALHRLRNAVSNGPNNILHAIIKRLNIPGGLNLSVDDLEPLLSKRAKLALAYSGRNLSDLIQFSKQQTQPLPLFPNYSSVIEDEISSKTAL